MVDPARSIRAKIRVMDPRLKAYQKQTRTPTPQAPKQTSPEAEPLPVVRPVQLPRFEEPPLVKTTKAPATPNSAEASMTALGGDKSLRKVAKFLILLGQDEAAKVVRHLDAGQVEALGREIAGIKKIEPVEAEAILQEFGYIATNQAHTVKGGKGTAQSILDRAFGGERAKSILKKAVPQAAEKPFAFFEGLEPDVVTALLGAESPAVLSVVVPFLAKNQAAGFLKTLDPATRLALVKRLAKMDKVPQAVVAQVETSLQERFHNLAPSNTEAVDGKARLADILRHMSATQEESILKSLGHAKPEISEDLRRRMFTVADLARVADEAFEDLLRAKTDTQLALLWLAHEGLRPKIRANISARRLLLVEAEVDLVSDTPLRELQKELRFFVDEVRDAVREGRAFLVDGEDYV